MQKIYHYLFAILMLLTQSTYPMYTASKSKAHSGIVLDESRFSLMQNAFITGFATASLLATVLIWKMNKEVKKEIQMDLNTTQEALVKMIEQTKVMVEVSVKIIKESEKIRKQNILLKEENNRKRNVISHLVDEINVVRPELESVLQSVDHQMRQNHNFNITLKKHTPGKEKNIVTIKQN
jgi:hypothetical protein